MIQKIHQPRAVSGRHIIMEEFRDYTIKNGIGIRLHGQKSCQVIRLVKGKWIEIGSVYDLPVEESALAWTKTGIPATVLAVAVRVYELDHPGTQLRNVLLRKEKEEVRARPLRPVVPQWRREAPSTRTAAPLSR